MTTSRSETLYEEMARIHESMGLSLSNLWNNIWQDVLDIHVYKSNKCCVIWERIIFQKKPAAVISYVGGDLIDALRELRGYTWIIYHRGSRPDAKAHAVLSKKYRSYAENFYKKRRA